MAVSVLLASADSFARRGIRTLLDSTFEIVCEACNGEDLVHQALLHEPDLIISDVSLPLHSALEAAHTIRAALPHTRFIFLGSEAHHPPAIDSLRASGTAYVNKSLADQLPAALEAVLHGACSFTTAGPTVEGLSERQIEILKLIAEGKSNKEMAHELDISIKTVEFHRGRLVRKLGRSSVADLTRIAMLHGLVDADLGALPLLVVPLAYACQRVLLSFA